MSTTIRSLTIRTSAGLVPSTFLSLLALARAEFRGSDPAQDSLTADRAYADANVTMPFPNVVPSPSSCNIRPQSHRRRTRQMRLPLTSNPWRTVARRAARHQGQQNTWAVRSGNDGADATAEAVQRQKCTM